MTSTMLAINGGTPVRRAPWRESNAIGEEERQAALRVLEHGRLSLFQGAYKPAAPYNFLGGPEVQALESLARQATNAAHAISMNSATSCLSAAIGALGLGFGDEVIVSPFTMSACAVAPLWYGAVPVFADVEEETGALDPESVRSRITPRTKAILVIHQFGLPADMDAILSIAREHNVRVIEDCAQAWGAQYRGRSVGTIGDIGIHSFNVHKTIQCGEGGVCLTNDERIARRLQFIRNHGEAVVEDAGEGDITNLVGANFRLTELQAAIAQEQWKKLPELNRKRIALADFLSKHLARVNCLSLPPSHPDRLPTYYIYPLRYHAELLGGLPRKEFARMLAAEGVPFMEGYIKPLYMLPLFQRKTAFKNGYPWTAPENRASIPSYAPGTCPVAERLFSQDLLAHTYVTPPQTEEDMADIVRAVEKVWSHPRASR